MIPGLAGALRGSAPIGPHLRGPASVSQQASGGTLAVTIPTHAVGDVLLVLVAYSKAASTPVGISASAGWTIAAQDQRGSGTPKVGLAVIWKVATSTSTTLTVTNANSERTVAQAFALEGGLSVEAATGLSPSYPGRVPSWGAALTLYYVVDATGGGGPSTVPGGFGDTLQSIQTDTYLISGNKIDAASSLSSGSFTGADVGITATVAVQPS